MYQAYMSNINLNSCVRSGLGPVAIKQLTSQQNVDSSLIRYHHLLVRNFLHRRHTFDWSQLPKCSIFTGQQLSSSSSSLPSTPSSSPFGQSGCQQSSLERSVSVEDFKTPIGGSKERQPAIDNLDCDINSLDQIDNTYKNLYIPSPTKSYSDMNLTPDSTHDDKLIAKFGVLTDVQYADTDDKPAHYDPTKTRYYRASLNHVVHAFNHWDKESIKPTFVLQFGDIIDGLNKRTNGLDPLDAITKTLAAFEAHPTIPTFHAVGNHELYNFKRAEIIGLFRDSLIKRAKLKIDLMGLNLHINEITDDYSDSPSASPSPDNYTLYYKFTPSPKLKIIALDCFEISVIGYDPSHQNYRQAEEILYKYHGHRDFDLWDIDDHLAEGPEKRFQQMNGALSEEQLQWLARELEDSERKGEKVIVFGHVCLHPGSCDWSCLVWNYDRVIETFHRYNCVISYMSGHAHKFGHSVDEKGIHYIVYHGVIETSPNNEAFATVSLYDNYLQVDGYGLEKSLTLPLTSSFSSSSSTDPVTVDPINSDDYDVTNYAEPVSPSGRPTTITVTV